MLELPVKGLRAALNKLLAHKIAVPYAQTVTVTSSLVITTWPPEKLPTMRSPAPPPPLTSSS
jgi:hypothetical protein